VNWTKLIKKELTKMNDSLMNQRKMVVSVWNYICPLVHSMGQSYSKWTFRCLG